MRVKNKSSTSGGCETWPSSLIVFDELANLRAEDHSGAHTCTNRQVNRVEFPNMDANRCKPHKPRQFHQQHRLSGTLPIVLAGTMIYGSTRLTPITPIVSALRLLGTVNRENTIVLTPFTSDKMTGRRRNMFIAANNQAKAPKANIPYLS